MRHSRPLISSVDKRTEEVTDCNGYEALLNWQIERVNKTVKYVKEKSAFYKERLKDINGEITHISQLPFTFPKDLEESGHKMLCVSQGMVSRIVSCNTSGTTGGCKRVFFTQGDMELTVDFFEHGMKEFTAENDRVLILFPSNKEGSIGKLLSKAVKRINAAPLEYGLVSDYGGLLAKLEKEKINVIVSMPRQALELSRLLGAKGVKVSGLHSILLSGDYVPDTIVSAVSKELGCNVYKHYGMSEMCFGGGVYSNRKMGYHMRHGDFLFEIVDPLTGVAANEYGEIVFTSLKAEAMPLIRYRTGDIGKLCKKFQKYPVIEKIKGRISGGIRLLNGYEITTELLDEIVFENEDVLDFNAFWNEIGLTLYVRTICPDCEDSYNNIIDRIKRKTRITDNIRILPMDEKKPETNTMQKRKIIFSLQ